MLHVHSVHDAGLLDLVCIFDSIHLDLGHHDGMVVILLLHPPSMWSLHVLLCLCGFFLATLASSHSPKT